VRIKHFAILAALGVSAAAGLSVTLNQADALVSAPIALAGDVAQERSLDPTAYATLDKRGFAPAPEPVVQSLVVGRGDTLMAMLTGVGVDRREAHEAIESLRAAWDPRQLRPGQEINVVFTPVSPLSRDDTRFHGISIATDVDRRVAVARTGLEAAFAVEEQVTELTPVTAYREGVIRTSLYEAAVDAGVPVPVLWAVVRNLSYDIDFQREVRKGDRFEILWHRMTDASGAVLREGEVYHAALTVSGQRFAMYRFDEGDYGPEYFDEKGGSVRKALLKTPIDGARISSGYGYRKHPILGYNKMHRGLDFAAPRGTPIYAAGNGVVERAGRFGSYGIYVRLRHAEGFSTAYAHMKGVARGVRAGARVKQGQVIGYVGSTGRSTGPHLHYEILRAGKQVNPLKVKFPSGRTLKGDALARFERVRNDLDLEVAGLRSETSIAKAPASE